MRTIVLMRAFLVSAVCVMSAAVLAFPLANSSGAFVPDGRRQRPATDEVLSGATRTLALLPLAGSASARSVPAAGAGSAPAAVRGVPAREVKPFSLLGVTWDDPGADLHGTVEVRTRAVGTGVWSGWRDVQAHDDDTPDLDAERVRGRRGASAPLWVGACDGVEVRVRPELTARAAAEGAPALPTGLRLEMVDPGTASVPPVSAGRPADRPTDRRVAPNGPGTPDQDGPPHEAGGPGPAGAPARQEGGATVIPALSQAETRAESGDQYIGPRPAIVTRAGWGADENLRESEFAYTDTVKAAFVHHSATGNDYSCDEAPALIRSIYRYHVESSHWRDIGYNFLVDKCGTIYEGRAGGVTQPVMGAHTLGFNTDSMGIAVLGTFTDEDPPDAAVEAVAHLTAWKLGLFGADPTDTTTLVSGGGNKYPKGSKVTLQAVSGHRDGFNTECPGTRLYDDLSSVRDQAGQLQGR